MGWIAYIYLNPTPIHNQPFSLLSYNTELALLSIGEMPQQAQKGSVHLGKTNLKTFRRLIQVNKSPEKAFLMLYPHPIAQPVENSMKYEI